MRGYHNQTTVHHKLISILLSVVLVLGTLNFAMPARIAESADRGFAAGSLIIPMDTTSQNMGMWKAYGLVYNLLQKGIPVSWAIASNKTFNGLDFTAEAKNLANGASAGLYNYTGGPFVISAADADAAKPIIQAWWTKQGSQPTVHEATASFNANVDIVLKSPPRIAVEETNAGIAITYLNAAGITDLNGLAWSTSSPNILSQQEIVDGALFTKGDCTVRKFDIFVTPHNSGYSYSLTDPVNLGTRTYAELDYFVNQGGGWMALCHSILSNENAIADLYRNGSTSVRSLFKATTNGGFLTAKGFTDIANKAGTWTVESPTLPVAQAVNTLPSVPQALPGGSVQTWNRSTVEYYNQTERIANFKALDGTIYDWAINGVAHNGETMGKVTFLGGHSYSTSLPYNSNFEAPYLRFFYNALFFNASAVAKLELVPSQTNIPKGMTSEMIVSLKNIGASTAQATSNLQIKLAPGVQYVSTVTGSAPTSITGDASSGTTLNWGSSLGSISGNSIPIEIKISLTPTAAGEKKIANLSVKYGDVYNEAFTADLCRAVFVYDGATPVITKSPKTQTLYSGQIASWTLGYRNTGSVPIQNGIVEDILPVGFTFRSSTPAPAALITLDTGATLIRWNVGTIDAGAAEKTIALTAYSGKDTGDTFINQVTLRGSDSFGYSYSASDTAKAAITTPPVSLVKSVSPTGPIEITSPGQILTYTIRPAYYGSNLLEDVLVSDVIPAYTTYVSGSVNAGGAYGFTPLPKQDGVDSDTFGSGKSVTVSLTASPALAKPGDTITVSLTLTNNSGVTISGITPGVAETLGGADYISGQPSAVFSLANGASSTLTYTFKATATGERDFTGSAAGTANSLDYSFPEGISNTVLVINGLKASPTNDVVAWRLGTSTPRISGETLISGYPAGIYAFRGSNTKEFSRYSLSTASWISRAPTTNGIEKGGSLTADGNGTIYASEGNSKIFYKYVIATNTWSQLAQPASNFNKGGAVQFMNLPAQVGTTPAGSYVYGLMGNSNVFRRYNIAANTWTDLATVPVTVKKGGALTTDGTYLYALQGDTKTGFYRYDIAANSWTAMASTPSGVGWGGSLTRVGGFIYAFRGDGNKDFWRYSISGNSWTSMASAPANVADGGSLTNDGTYVYAQQGKTKAFWRYSITNNSWEALMNVNFTDITKQGGALTYDPGTSPQGYFTTMATNAGLVTSGDTVKVTFTAKASVTSSVTGVVPSTVSFTATGGASATLLTGPVATTDTTISDSADAVIYEWTYRINAGTTPGSIAFTATANGNSQNNLFPAATSRSVLVTPPLTFQAQAFNAANMPPEANQITNAAMIDDSVSFATGIDSNAVSNALLRPSLSLEKYNDPQGPVNPGDEITYTLVLRNDGMGTARTVQITDLIPANSTYVSGSAQFTGSAAILADTTRVREVIPPATSTGTLTFKIDQLKMNEILTMRFKVKALESGTTGTTYTIKNKAQAQASNYAAVTSTEVTNSVTFNPSLSVIKLSDPEEVYQPGAVVQYQVLVTNTGNAALTGITVNDPMLPNLAYVSGNDNGNLALDVGETWLYTGSYTVTEADYSKPASGGVIPLVNTVTADSNETSPVQAQDKVELALPKLELTKSADVNEIGPGGTIRYTLTLRNKGKGIGRNITVNDLIPTNTTYVPGSAAASSTTVPPANLGILEPAQTGDPIAFTVSSLGFNEEVTMSFSVQASSSLAPGTYSIDNSASIKDTAITSNTVTTTLTFRAGLAVTKTAAPTEILAAGDVIGYTIQVKNTGNMALSGITVTDPMLAAVPLTLTSGDTNSDNKLDLAETWIYQANYTTQPADFSTASGGTKDLINTVTADSAETDPLTATATVKLYSPDLAIQKSVDLTTVSPGDLLTYTVTLTNNGPGTAKTLEIRDIIPAYTKYVPGTAVLATGSLTQGVSLTEPTGTEPLKVTIDALKSQEKVIVTFKVKTKTGLDSGIYDINNKATLTWNSAEVQSNEVKTSLEVYTLELRKQVLADSQGLKGDPDTPFVFRITNLPAPSTQEFDVVLRDGESVTLTLPKGTYSVREVGIPMEYSPAGYIVTVDGIEEPLADPAKLNLKKAKTIVTFKNQFGHSNYFHDSDYTINQFPGSP